MRSGKFFKFLRATFGSLFYYTIFNWRGFRKMKIWEKLLTLFVTFFSSFIVLLLAVEFNFLGLFGKMPSIESIEHKISSASYVYTADGVLIRKYFDENRTPIRYMDIPQSVISCLIATEDVRFYEHAGIDFTAVFSAIWSNLRGEKRGASTITQQLAKNLFKTRRTSSGLLSKIGGLRVINYKLKEWITAVKLEWRYDKEQILAMYLNTVDFGSNSYGLKTASTTFFNKKPQDLTLTEAATLIGGLKATHYYNPIVNPENSKSRRNVVLSQLQKYGKIDAETCSKLQRADLNTNINLGEDRRASVPHFERFLTKELEKWCKKNNYNLYTDGLRIYTTINSKMQKVAEEAVAKHMSILQGTFDRHWYYSKAWDRYKPEKGKDYYIITLLKKSKSYGHLFKKYDLEDAKIQLEKRKKMRIFTWKGEKDTLLSPIDSIKHYIQTLQTGLLTIDPKNGYIKTWVGSINYKYFKYDHVRQSKRQPGSTFKPFVYTEAFEQGLGPCDRRLDAPVTIVYEEDGETKHWSPSNSDYEYTYRNLTLRKAMGTSKNTVTAKLTEELTPRAVRRRAELMGITSYMKDVPSIGLGSNEVSLYEMVSAYACFVNDGFWTEPQLIMQIEDKYGNVLQVANPKKRKAMKLETAYLMRYMLIGSVEEQDGTSQNLYNFPELFEDNNQIGGKTGTSSGYADGWYFGVSKDFVTGVWIGADDPRIRFRTPEIGEASQTALPLYGLYMKMLYEKKELRIRKGKFPEPKFTINKPHNCLTPYRVKIKKKDEEDTEIVEDD